MKRSPKSSRPSSAAARPSRRLDSVSPPGDTTRSDGLVNLYTGLGMKGRDKTKGATYFMDRPLHFRVLDAMYRSGGMAGRIIDLPVDEMLREGFDVEGDTDDEMNGELERIGAHEGIVDLLTWAGLYGGAIGVMGVDDGGDFEDPVREESIKSVEFLHVYDRWQCWWTTQDLYQDANTPKFQKPEFYTVTPYQVPGQFRVHESRVLRRDGRRLPERLRWANQGWGDSVLQVVFDALTRFDSGYASTANILEEFVTGKLEIENLSDMVAAGKAGEDKIAQRLNILDMGKHVINTLLLAKGESYSKESSSVAGLAEILDRNAQHVSGITGIPVTLLMGQAPAGLAATGASDIRFWYDKMAARQTRELTPLLRPLLRYVMLGKLGPFKGKEIEGWKVEYRPLWQMTDTERAEYRYKCAQRTHLEVQDGIVEPDEVGLSRYGGEHFSDEIKIDVQARKAAIEAAKKRATEPPPPVPSGVPPLVPPATAPPVAPPPAAPAAAA